MQARMERCTLCDGSGWVTRSIPLVIRGGIRGSPKHYPYPWPPDETEVIHNQQCGCSNGWRQTISVEADHIRNRKQPIVLGNGTPENPQKEAY